MRKTFDHKRFFIITGLLPLLIILVGLTVYPFIMNIYMSMVDYYMVSPAKGSFNLFANYGNVLGNIEFWKTFRNTIFFTVGAVLLELFIGIFVAFLLSSRILVKSIGFIRPLIIFPLAIPTVALSYGWKLLLNPSVGLIPYIVKQIGLGKADFLTTPSQVIPSLIFIDAWQWSPFMIVIFTGALLALPTEPYEAARIDGASNVQIFGNITLPLLRSTIIFAVMLRFIDSFKVFDVIYLVTSGGPGRSSESISMFAFNQAFNRLRMGNAAAISIIMLIILFALSFVFRKFSNISED